MLDALIQVLYSILRAKYGVKVIPRKLDKDRIRGRRVAKGKKMASKNNARSKRNESEDDDESAFSCNSIDSDDSEFSIKRASMKDICLALNPV